MDSLDDDLVTKLLVQDAKDSSLKYSSMGLDAFKSTRPPANKPKPSTRFLRNIIKETDSHNAALLAKEATEAQARLDHLAGKRPAAGDIRKRQLGDIAAILGGGPRKRKRVEEARTPRLDERRNDKVKGESKSPELSRRRTEEASEKNSRHQSSRDEHVDDRRESRKRRHRDSEDEEPRESRKRRSRDEDEDVSRDRRHRSRPADDDSNDKSRKRRHRSLERYSRTTATRRHRSPSPGPRRREEKKVVPADEEYDSDPLASIIGPRPASPISTTRPRGRGAIALSSGIDGRFAASYDPSNDIQPDPETADDWDQALEAMRDRQKFQKHGAERLKAAGFTEEEVKKWEKGKEKTEEDVRWSKRGEGREWDKGKVMGEDGSVRLQADWGRLTNE